MTIDLKSMNRKQLEKLKSDIEKALDKIEKQDKKAAIAAAEKAAKAHGFSLAEITDGAPAPKPSKSKAAKRAKSPGKPQFANPDDKSQTWTGKGRQPEWYKAAIAAGKLPEELKV